MGITIDDVVRCLDENISHTIDHIEDGHGIDGAIEAVKRLSKIAAWEEVLDYISNHRE